jgi:putative transposase
MADHGIACSLSRSGNVRGNAAMDSFFSSLKTAWIGRRVHRTRDDARADVIDYIERFCNPTRGHSAVGYISPLDFEKPAMRASLRVLGTGSSSYKQQAMKMAI